MAHVPNSPNFSSEKTITGGKSPRALTRCPSSEKVKDLSPITPTRVFRRLSQLELAVEHTLLNRTDVEEAMLLQRSFYESGHWEYAGLFSTLLMDVDMLLKLFNDNHVSFPNWKDTLVKTESRGYGLLITKLESTFSV
jgi:hypothetical protein